MPTIPIIVQSPDTKPLVLLETITGVNPGLGAEFFYTFPANQRTQIMSLSLRFVADANIAIRLFRFVLSSPNGPIFQSTGATQINENMTRYCTLAPGIPYYSGLDLNPYTQIPLPPGIVCFEGFTLQTITDNLQVGDQFQTIAAQFLTQIETD